MGLQQKMSNQNSVAVKNLWNTCIFKREGDTIKIMSHLLYKEKQKWTKLENVTDVIDSKIRSVRVKRN